MTYDREIRKVENDRQGCLIYKWIPDGNYEFGVQYYYNKNTLICVDAGTLAVVYLNNGKEITEHYHLGNCCEPLFPDEFIKSLPFSVRIRGQIDERVVEIYFMRYSEAQTLDFGVPYFRTNDIYSGRTVSVAVRGRITYSVPDHLGFITAYGIRTFKYDSFRKKLRETLILSVRKIISEAPERLNIPLFQLESRTFLINNMIKEEMDYILYKEFNISLESVNVSAIEVQRM